MKRAALAALLIVPSLACTRAPAERVVEIDGGTQRTAWIGPVTVQARAGETVVVTNANSGEASPSHALVAASADGQVPPLFVGLGGGGVAPNPGLWGECHGGEASAARGNCPIPTIEGPAAWDGRAYWSTGQILPGEQRRVPLDPAIDEGRYSFYCAFHPTLAVHIEVVSEPVELEPAPERAEPAVRGLIAPGRVSAGFHLGRPLAEVFVFRPSETVIARGETVTWRVDLPSPHTVELGAIESVDLLDTVPPFTVPNAPRTGWNGRDEVHSGYLSTDPSAPGGRSFTLRFNRAGVYEYVCRFHSQMRGIVRVTR